MLPISIRQQTFWDTELDHLDTEKHADFIILRVFERGWLDELVEVLVYYEESRVIKALVSAPSLSERTLHFAAGLFQIKPEDFKCYGKKQLHPIA